MAAGSASVLAWYGVLTFAYTLDEKNHHEYVGRTYWTGVILCLVSAVAALVGKRAPRILTLIAMLLLLLYWALTLGPLITPP